MGAFAVAVAVGLVAGISAAAPWVIYARQVVPRLADTHARPAAFFLAALPAALASIATFAALVGFTTGSLQQDVTLIAAIVGIACSWSPIVRGALMFTGGAREAIVGDLDTRVTLARMIGYLMAALVVVESVLVYAGPAYASMITCFDAEAILADAEPPPANGAPLADALPYTPPEPGATYVFHFPMNLEQTASSRHDPATRDQLADAGFEGAHLRAWYAADGRGIQADVMEFGTPHGAAAYQAQVTRHACQYANEAFEAPMGGIGMQVRYGTGDPIVEQISWVAGNRRYLVSVTEDAAPADHRRILAILDAATLGWPVGGPAPGVDPSPQPSSTPRPVTDPTVIERALDDVRAALEATITESTVWINKRSVFTGSSEIPDGASAFAGGQMSLEDARKMRVLLQFAAIADTERNSAEVILDGSLALLRGRLFDDLTGEGRWLLVDLASSDPRVEPFQSLASGHNDPSMALFSLYGATRILGVSDDVVDGMPVRRYTVNIQLDAAIDEIPDEFASGYLANLDAITLAQVEPQYTAEVWVGEDGLVHHIEYTQELGPELGGGSMSTTADFSDFGLPLELDFPHQELITPIEDVTTPVEPLPQA